MNTGNNLTYFCASNALPRSDYVKKLDRKGKIGEFRNKEYCCSCLMSLAAKLALFVLV